MSAKFTGRVMSWVCLFFLFVGTVRAQDEENPLTYGITGSERGAYSSAMRDIAVQKLLLDIAAEPRSQDFVEAVLKDTGVTRQQLEELQLIRRQGTDYVISFTLFTSSDVGKVREASEGYGRSLAADFLARRAEIETALQQYQVSGVDPKEVAYILLGCFSLDWDGLDLTAEKGYRTTAKLTPNGQYVPWAEQKSEITLKGIYWGSHNNYLEEVVFTSFGDHFSLPRYAFPDLVWRLPRRATQGNLPESLRPKLARVLRQSLKGMMRNAARLMFALRVGGTNLEKLANAAGLPAEEAEELLALLAELDYVAREGERYSLRIPVLTERDRRLVQEVERIGREVMDRWLQANFEKVKSELNDITPLKYGVPLDESFTQIWHYIFGIANRQLVEAGVFADPYAENRKYKGFIPVVWHPSLARSP